MKRLTAPALAVVIVLAASVWAAWLGSPERAALLADEEVAELRQLLASERAELALLRADCAEAGRENGPAHGAAVCDHYRLQATMARERMERISTRLQELQGSGGDRI